MKHRSTSNQSGLLASFATVLVATLIFAGPSTSQQVLPTIQPNGPAWKVDPVLQKNADARKAISGAACVPISPPICLAANDEKKYAQFFSIKDKLLVPSELIRLVLDKEDDVVFDELDAEGVAYDKGFFYVVGSHGAPRKPGKPIDPTRFWIFRFKVDLQTGKPGFKFSDDFVDTKEIIKRNTLRGVIKNAPDIGPFAEKPLGENGANIEGIAVKGERIYLGFRGPSVSGTAFILEVDEKGVFEAEAVNPKVHPVRLGEKIGIRDLAGLKTSGVLILAGPAPDASGSYSVHHWDEQSKALKPLAALDGVPPGGKPETLIVLDETDPKHYRVLVLIESIENANPLEYLVPR